MKKAYFKLREMLKKGNHTIATFSICMTHGTTAVFHHHKSTAFLNEDYNYNKFRRQLSATQKIRKIERLHIIIRRAYS